jgi:hypothetical protein
LFSSVASRVNWFLNPYNVDVNSFVDAVCDLAAEGRWSGTVAELSVILSALMPKEKVPPTTFHLVGVLEMMTAFFETCGLSVTFEGRGRERTIHLRRMVWDEAISGGNASVIH